MEVLNPPSLRFLCFVQSTKLCSEGARWHACGGAVARRPPPHLEGLVDFNRTKLCRKLIRPGNRSIAKSIRFRKPFALNKS